MLNNYTVHVQVGDIVQQIEVEAKNQDGAMDEILSIVGLDYLSVDKITAIPFTYGKEKINGQGNQRQSLATSQR